MTRGILRLALYLFIGLVLCAFPFVVNDFLLTVMIWALWYIYFGAFVNLQIGYSGQLSLAFPVYLASGAYTAAYLNIHFGISPWLGMIAGGLIAAFIASLVCWICSRYTLPHLSFVIATLAFLYIVEAIVKELPRSFLGGYDGLCIVSRGNDLLQFQFETKQPYYFVILLMTVGGLFLIRYILNSKAGIYFKAIRDNELAAAASGVDILRYKLLVNALVAFLLSFAGAFYVQLTLFVDPGSMLTAVLIIEIIAYISIGGLGTFWGPVVGCLLFVPISELLRSKLALVLPGIHLALLGVIIILVIELAPRGIVGWFEHRRAQRRAAMAELIYEEAAPANASPPPLWRTYIRRLFTNR